MQIQITLFVAGTPGGTTIGQCGGSQKFYPKPWNTIFQNSTAILGFEHHGVDNSRGGGKEGGGGGLCEADQHHDLATGLDIPSLP